MPSANWYPDVVATVTDGQNAGLAPELLPPSQFAYGRNLSIRGGRIRTRPSIVPLELNVPLLTGPHTDSFGKVIASQIQGAAYFSIKNGRLLVSVAGRIFEIDPVAGTNTELTNFTGSGTRPHDYGNPTSPRHWYCQTVDSMVIQDGQMTPYIYDGASWRNAVIFPGDATNEVPVGTCMCYSNGRLAVVLNDTNVMIGDIVKGGLYQSELKFTETFNLLGGGTFSFPSAVKALSSLPVVDSASGQGSLVVGCRERAYTLHTEVTARENWDNIGFQTEMFPGDTVGIVGPKAVAGVNQDIFFRAKDGLRSARITYGDYDSPGLTPLSTEVNNRLDYDTDMWLQDACVVLFDNRLLCTHSPTSYGTRSIANGLISLNFDIVTNRGEKNPPAFEGEWDCGIQIAEIVKGEFNGETRCFLIGRDVNGVNGIWEILKEVSDPVQPADEPTYIHETRAIAGAGLNAIKAIRRCDVWLSRIEDPIELKVYWRPDKYPYWVLWDTLEIATAPSAPWTNQKRIARAPFSTSTPPTTLDNVRESSLDTGFSFQVRLEWTGRCRVDYVQIMTEQLPAPDAANNVDSEASTTQYSGPPDGQIDDQFWFPFAAPPQP